MLTIPSIVAILSTAVLLVRPVVADNPVIVATVDGWTNLEELCYSFTTLDRAAAYPAAPIIVFKGKPLSQSDESSLASCGNPRPVTFVDKIDYYRNIPSSMRKVGQNYDYQQTQRFLTSQIWKEPALNAYDTVMRVTDATCLTFTSEYLPGFPPNDPPLEYKSYTIPNQLELTKYTVGLYDTTAQWMSSQNIYPTFIFLWQGIVKNHEYENKIAKFSDDFEVISKAFMLRPEVRAYHDYLANSVEGQKAFYKRKWGWGVIMYLTVAIFGNPNTVSNVHVPGIVEKDMLAKNFFPNICRPTAAQE